MTEPSSSEDALPIPERYLHHDDARGSAVKNGATP